jgi:hypothetical protein
MNIIEIARQETHPSFDDANFVWPVFGHHRRERLIRM